MLQRRSLSSSSSRSEQERILPGTFPSNVGLPTPSILSGFFIDEVDTVEKLVRFVERNQCSFRIYNFGAVERGPEFCYHSRENMADVITDLWVPRRALGGDRGFINYDDESGSSFSGSSHDDVFSWDDFIIPDGDPQRDEYLAHYSPADDFIRAPDVNLQSLFVSCSPTETADAESNNVQSTLAESFPLDDGVTSLACSTPVEDELRTVRVREMQNWIASVKQRQMPHIAEMLPCSSLFDQCVFVYTDSIARDQHVLYDFLSSNRWMGGRFIPTQSDLNKIKLLPRPLPIGAGVIYFLVR